MSLRVIPAAASGFVWLPVDRAGRPFPGPPEIATSLQDLLEQVANFYSPEGKGLLYVSITQGPPGGAPSK